MKTQTPRVARRGGKLPELSRPWIFAGDYDLSFTLDLCCEDFGLTEDASGADLRVEGDWPTHRGV